MCGVRVRILAVEVNVLELPGHGFGRGMGDPLYAQALARMQVLLEEAERWRKAERAERGHPVNFAYGKGLRYRALACLRRQARAVIRMAIAYLRVAVAYLRGAIANLRGQVL